MKKIFDFFKQWDKLAHACFGFLIMLWASALFLFWFNFWWSLAFGTLVTALCAFGKEFYDSFAGGTPEWKDIIACAVGWALSLIPLLIIGFRLIAL